MCLLTHEHIYQKYSFESMYIKQGRIMAGAAETCNVIRLGNILFTEC